MALLSSVELALSGRFQMLVIYAGSSVEETRSCQFLVHRKVFKSKTGNRIINVKHGSKYIRFLD